MMTTENPSDIRNERFTRYRSEDGRKRVVIGLLAALAVGLISTTAQAYPPLMTRDDIVCRGHSGVGFSYWWGGACWCQNGCNRDTSCSAGSCSGSCPNCTHYGGYGADCSGFVTKVWQIPDPIATTTCGHGPYVAASYRSSTSYWTVIDRGSAIRGDALASTTHIILMAGDNGWGNVHAYEAMGCSYGIVDNVRGFGTNYSAARRVNIGTPCDCSEGQTQTEVCGNCGRHTRTCQSNCRWGNWGPCEGQGVCAAGSSEARACCDCGTQTRVCSSTCSWGDWSGCAGPDPDDGNQVCNTREPGPCAEGRVRCIQGCLQCRRIYEPIPEICDEIDNDCSGEVDDGNPTVLGNPPPPYAATLLDSASSYTLKPGEKTGAWAVFRNDGLETWQQGVMWLAALYDDNQKKQTLYDPDSWPAYDVAALLTKDVEPGDVAFFNWTVKLPDDSSSMSQTFRLMDPVGNLLKCPTPEFVVTLKTGQISDDSESQRLGNQTDNQDTTPNGSDAGNSADGGAESSSSGCGCELNKMSSKDYPSSAWMLIGTLGTMLVSCRRARRRGYRSKGARAW